MVREVLLELGTVKVEESRNLRVLLVHISISNFKRRASNAL